MWRAARPPRAHAIIATMDDPRTDPGEGDGRVDSDEDDEPTVPSYLTRLAATPEGARVLAHWFAAVEREEDDGMRGTS